jgi:hypothetical protein
LKNVTGDDPATSVPALARDIVQDAERLIVQQFDLLRSEVRQGLQQAGGTMLSLSAGAGLVAAGGMLATLMLVHGVQRATRLPLWSCYGLVGGALGAAGAALLANGRRQLGGLQLIPEQSAAALKENLAWLKEQVTAAT